MVENTLNNDRIFDDRYQPVDMRTLLLAYESKAKIQAALKIQTFDTIFDCSLYLIYDHFSCNPPDREPVLKYQLES